MASASAGAIGVYASVQSVLALPPRTNQLLEVVSQVNLASAFTHRSCSLV